MQLQALVAELHAIIAPVAEEKNLRLVIDAPDDLRESKQIPAAS